MDIVKTLKNLGYGTEDEILQILESDRFVIHFFFL